MLKNKNLQNSYEIPANELRTIIKQGAMLRLPYLESRFLQAKKNVQNYEKKYKTDFKKLKLTGLPEDAGYDMHEDFIEWEYWYDVMNDTGQIVDQINKLLKEVAEEKSEY